MAKKPNFRKISVVDSKVQWTLARRVVLHFFVFVCAGAVFGLVNQFLLDPFGGLKQNLNAFLRNSAPMLVALLCLLPIFIRDTLTLTNRIAGPIHNLKNTIRKISEGQEDVRPLTFRKGDMMEDLPDLFNGMVEKLRTVQTTSNVQERETEDQRELVEV